MEGKLCERIVKLQLFPLIYNAMFKVFLVPESNLKCSCCRAQGFSQTNKYTFFTFIIKAQSKQNK